MEHDPLGHGYNTIRGLGETRELGQHSVIGISHGSEIDGCGPDSWLDVVLDLGRAEWAALFPHLEYWSVAV